MLVATVLTAYQLWRTRHFQPEKPDQIQQLKLATLILLSLLIPPTVWMHATVPALIAVLAVLLALASPNTPRWQLFLFALTYATLAYGSRYDFFGDEVFGLTRLGSSYRFLAVLALWVLCLKGLTKKGLADSTKNQI
jgi:hypothetical protein